MDAQNMTLNSGEANCDVLHLVGLVTYYGKHYSCFFYNSQLQVRNYHLAKNLSDTAKISISTERENFNILSFPPDLVVPGRRERKRDRQLLAVRRGQVHKGIFSAANAALCERKQFEFNKHQHGTSGDLSGA